MTSKPPPLAEPAKTVIFPSSSTASMAAMRPLMVAEPMFLAVRPEMVPESYFTAVVCAETVESAHRSSTSTSTKNHGSLQKREQRIDIMKFFPLVFFCLGYFVAGVARVVGDL